MERSHQGVQPVLEPLRAALAGAHEDTGRYAVGLIVADVKRAPGRYGAGAVGRLARLVGEDVETLYRYAAVAERFSPCDLQALLVPDDDAGERLSWSHLVLLAAVPSAAERAEWAARALDERLSVRELEAALLGATPPSPAASASP